MDRQLSQAGSKGEPVVTGPVSHERQKIAVDDGRIRAPQPELAVSRPVGQQQLLQNSNDRAVDIQSPQGGSKGQLGPLLHERHKFAADEGRISARQPELAVSRPVGQFQQQQQQQPSQQLQQNVNQAMHYPAAATTTTYPHPVSSGHLPSTSVPAGGNFAPRQSSQHGGPRPPQWEDRQDDRSRQLIPPPGRNHPSTSTADPPRFAPELRGGSEFQTRMAKEVAYDPRNQQQHWRQASYDGRSDARGYSRPETARTPTLGVDPRQSLDQGGSYPSSNYSSQPDLLLRYLDRPEGRSQSTRLPRESLQMVDQSYRPMSSYLSPPPSHSRSASNPVTLRAQGSNASASAVDSLFAYHQKSPTSPIGSPPESSGSQTTYLPSAAAVQHISMQAQGNVAAPAKPPRLASSGVAAAYPYDYAVRRDSDQQEHAEYAQQVSCIVCDS